MANNHFVPQRILRQWRQKNSSNMVRVQDKDRDYGVRDRSTKSICSIDDMYTTPYGTTLSIGGHPELPDMKITINADLDTNEENSLTLKEKKGDYRATMCNLWRTGIHAYHLDPRLMPFIRQGGIKSRFLQQWSNQQVKTMCITCSNPELFISDTPVVVLTKNNNAMMMMASSPNTLQIIIDHNWDITSLNYVFVADIYNHLQHVYSIRHIIYPPDIYTTTHESKTIKDDIEYSNGVIAKCPGNDLYTDT